MNLKKSNRWISALCALVTMPAGGAVSAEGVKAKNANKMMPSSVSQEDIEKHARDRSAVISFDMGSAALSEGDKAKIRELVAKAGTDNISRIEIASWSDKAFPKTGSDLPKADRDLADLRARNISDYLKTDLDLSRMKITTYDMAETSNWLARMMRTDEAELKSVFAKQATAPMARADFNMIGREGSPSKAVLVLVYK